MIYDTSCSSLGNPIFHSFSIEQQPRSPRAVTSAAMAAEEAVRRERAARSLAIEKAYVHDVYEQVGKRITCRAGLKSGSQVVRIFQAS